MEQTDCLPKIFATSENTYYNPGGRFCIYGNSIYNRLGIFTNVIQPLQNIEVSYISCDKPHGTLIHTILREEMHEGVHYTPCIWKHLGYELTIRTHGTIEIVVPVIEILINNVRNHLTLSPRLMIRGYPIVPIQHQGVYARAEIMETEGVMESTRIPQVPIQIPSKIPIHIQKIVLTDAVTKNDHCPILSEPITMDNGVVTSCGHVFIKEAINTWLSTNTRCPICKTNCCA